MKQSSTSNHLPGFVSKHTRDNNFIYFEHKLEQLNKELQTAIDYIKSLMNTAETKSSSNWTEPKSGSEPTSNQTETVTTENKDLRGNFVEDSVQEKTETDDNMSFGFSKKIPEETNYYYGGKFFSKGSFLSRLLDLESNIETDNLLFDSLEKMEILKNKINSPNKFENTSKKSCKIETLFEVKHDNHVKKLDVSSLDKRKIKLTSIKRENNSKKNTVEVIPTNAQTNVPAAEYTKEVAPKLPVNNTLETQTTNILVGCDKTTNTDFNPYCISKEIQTIKTNTDSSSQTTTQRTQCDVGMNTNYAEKHVRKSRATTPIYNISSNESMKMNENLLRRLDTGLQTSFVVLKKPEKEKHKKTSTNWKKNEKVVLYPVVRDNSIQEYGRNQFIMHDCYNSNPIKHKSTKKLKHHPQTEFYKYNNKFYEKPVKEKHQTIHPRHLRSCSDKLLVVPKDFALYGNYPRQQFRYIEKPAPSKKGYDHNFFQDDILENMYYITDFKQSSKCRKSKLRKPNECVNIEGVDIKASTKVSLLDILNAL